MLPNRAYRHHPANISSKRSADRRLPGWRLGWNAKSQYQFDPDSGLLLGNRYYDPSVGRFISQDPAQDESNWYAYCGNNPLVAVDPSGLFPIPNPGSIDAQSIMDSANAKADAFWADLAERGKKTSSAVKPMAEGTLQQENNLARAVASKDPNQVATAIDGITANDEVASVVEQAMKRARLPRNMRFSDRAMKEGGRALVNQIIEHIGKLEKAGSSNPSVNHWLQEIMAFTTSLGQKMKAG